jgi:preprotein translocase subunit SecD
MDRRYINLILILALIAAIVWVDLPRAEGSTGIKIGSFQRTLNPVLGLDLRGGMQVLLAPQAGVTADAQSLSDTAKILESRANGLGVSEVVFQVAGGKYILGEFPGLTNTDQVIASVKQTGLLEFVDAGSTPLTIGTIVKTDGSNKTNAASLAAASGTPMTPVATTVPATATPVTTGAATPTAAPTIVAANGTTLPADKVWHTVMTGDGIKDVTVETSTGSGGGFAVGFTLTPDGTIIFKDYTTNNINKYLAIVLDKKVISCPVIEGAIPTGSGQISGTFTSDEANNLAITLRYGRLSVPVELVQSKIIGPSLGADSLRKSLFAGLIGFAIIALFLIIYYRLPGAVAVLAILFYAGLNFAIYKLLPVTISLPGIAGFLLSTGGAVDANILIFERLKEELRNGRTLKQAIDLGWKRAWPSIRDSNVATAITSVILFWFGSTFGASIVKGFALTLLLGVIISIFTAVVVTRNFLGIVIDLIKPADHKKWFGA